MIAKASGSGVWCTSAPRILKVQATACGSETTNASALSFLISARMRSSFCAAGSPANCRSCGTTAPWGGAGDRPRGGAGVGEPLGPFSRVQPGIEAEFLSGREVGFDPDARRRVDEMLDREQLGVGLVAGLERIAAVDEQTPALGEDDGSPGRSGESGEPGKPLFARRQIFILVAIRVGHHEAIKPTADQLRPQRREAWSGLRRLRGIVVGLELSVKILECHFVHDRILEPSATPHNSCRSHCRASSL